MVKRFLGRGKRQHREEDPDMAIQAARGRFLIEESREVVVVVDDSGRVLAASRRARESLGVNEGGELPSDLLEENSGRGPVLVPYEVDGRRETLVYLGVPGDQAAYEELRAGFTAAVSHELRTPLARVLALLESTDLPGADIPSLLHQARSEVEQARELIDDVLFLSELETGHEVVALGSVAVLSVLDEVAHEYAERAGRAGLAIIVEGDSQAVVPVRPRMLRVVVANLIENAIRYAGEGVTLKLTVFHEEGNTVLSAADNGAGVERGELARLFERFYRSDHARTSRGTGLGLAIVKHVVVAGGGEVEARGGLGRGLQIRCIFPPERLR
jgi:signal transduction histidine kinase